MRKPAVWELFGSKDGLCRACVEQAVQLRRVLVELVADHCWPEDEVDATTICARRPMGRRRVSSMADPLLAAIENLSRFHRDHEKFYAQAPREQAVRVQRHARTLSALADRWSSAMVERIDVLNPFEGADDLNDATALQLDGVLFMEGGGEPVEITRIKRDLRTQGDDSIGPERGSPRPWKRRGLLRRR